MEAQIIGDPGYQGIECGITGEAEDVIDVVVLVRPVHRLDAAVMAVAAPHDAGSRPMPSQMLRHVLDDGPPLRALRGARRAQDRHHRRAASRVIDVHRREAALTGMGVPERQLLAAMGHTEGVVDVEHLHPPRRHRGAELVDERDREPRRIDLAWRILQPLMVDCEASGAPLSGQRPTATFISGSCRSSLGSIASSGPQAIAVTRAVTISTIWCWIWSGSRRSGIVSASRRHTPTSRSASRSNSAPPLED